MSLVAYGSSDESSDDEGNDCGTENENQDAPKVTVQRTNDKLRLPKPKHDTVVEKVNDNDVGTEIDKENDSSEKIHFDKLPKPKYLITEAEEIVEEDDIPPKKEIELKAERPIKKDRAPVKITVPSLSEFKDLEEENVPKFVRIKSSDKSAKLFALLPPPKGFETKITKNLIPDAVNKATVRSIQIKGRASNDADTKDSNPRKITHPVITKGSIGISYDSNSEDEDDTMPDSGNNRITDFFALTATETVSVLPDSSDTSVDLHTIALELKNDSKKHNDSDSYLIRNTDTDETESVMKNSQTSLVSNVINLPKEEILLKNKAEVGPKLPVPEQEYNVDVEGNVAFDDKAIEYLCGRRGVKRKPKEVEEANIIEINGEDIKPDEREWLVKALTEEPVQRPISMQGGINSQSKKKHQITYLAHQAKAMEMELKNQWAQNRLTRKQTQSKYGF